MELALEAGAEDFKTDEHGYEILTDPAHFEPIHKQVESRGIRCEAAEITAIPTLTVPLTEDTSRAAVTHLIDILEDHDDVKDVYSNADFTE